MKYNIVSAPSYSLIEMNLSEGESVIVEPGSMAWMDTTIKPKTEMKGGFFAGIKRRFAGESFFLNTYSAEGGSGNIGIGTTSPSQKLEVNGLIKITGSGGQGVNIENSGGTNAACINLKNTLTNYVVLMFLQLFIALHFQTLLYVLYANRGLEFF